MRSALVVGFLLLVWCGAVSATEWEDLPDEPCENYHHFKDGIGNITIRDGSSFTCKVLIPASIGEAIRIKISTFYLECGEMKVYLKKTEDNRFRLNKTFSSGERPFQMLFTDSSVGLYIYGQIRNPNYDHYHQYSCPSKQLSLLYSRGSTVDWTMHAGNDTSVEGKTGSYGSYHFPSAVFLETWTEPADNILCINGGSPSVSSLRERPCACPPGFAGATCKQACGPNHFGAQCENRCSEGPQGCRGKSFQLYQHPWFSCAAGFSGPRCDELCGRGQYGANCTQQCGQCSGEEGCDRYTGDCSDGCKRGYYGTQCKHEFTHLLYGPNITAVSETSFSGSVLLNQENIAGEGHVEFYEVQYKEFPIGKWTKAVVGRVDEVPTLTLHNFTVTGLKPDTDLAVRVLLRGKDLNTFPFGSYVKLRTLGPRRVADLVVSNVTSRGMRLSWTSPAVVPPAPRPVYSVHYQCLSLLGCTGSCPDVAGEVLVSETSVVLQGLQPAAEYRVTVSAGDHWDSVVVSTPLAIPAASALVSALRVQHVTNSSAVLQWGPPDCPAVHGLQAGYRWQLSSWTDPQAANRTAYSTSPAAVLGDLEPLASYQLSVAVLNTEGAAEQPWAAVNFTTLPTVPDAPLDLAVYRQNRTSLWVRWRPPARPSGKLRYYTVQVAVAGKQQRSENVEPDRKCPAWPDLICFSLHRLRPNTEHAVSVTATNEHGDQPGERSNARATTTKEVSLPPQHLVAKRRSLSSVVLQWQLPDLLNTDLTFFEVQVTRKLDVDSSAPIAEDPEPVRVHVTEELPVYEYTLRHLQPGATYNVAVRCGWGGLPANLEVSTLPSLVVSTLPEAISIVPPL